MSRTLLSLAGFQVIISGRFWVIAEAASLVLARHKILRIVTDNEGPFYCTVEKGNEDHVGKLRFLEGGGPVIKIASMVDSQVPAQEPVPVSSNTEPVPPAQSDLFRK